MPDQISTGLNGTLAVRTASIYRLNKFYIPIELITDLKPGLGTNRVTIDVIEGESYNQSYSVTDNVLQDFSFATSNIRRQPRVMSVTGVMASVLPNENASPSVAYGVPESNKNRLDLVRFSNLEKIASECQPVGVYTPRHAFSVCALLSIDASWDPNTGINTRLSINIKEIRIANPLQGNFVTDYNALSVANAANSSLGIQSASATTVTPNQIYFSPENFVY